ncbi:MAG: hypothetical protein LBG58_15875 [Planctomycetaceae bacterium]|nr:hypothetical protein [Planctomycetaceae bacterium]
MPFLFAQLSGCGSDDGVLLRFSSGSPQRNATRWQKRPIPICIPPRTKRMMSSTPN